jgi:hypothetical protein
MRGCSIHEREGKRCVPFNVVSSEGIRLGGSKREKIM